MICHAISWLQILQEDILPGPAPESHDPDSAVMLPSGQLYWLLKKVPKAKAKEISLTKAQATGTLRQDLYWPENAYMVKAAIAEVPGLRRQTPELSKEEKVQPM